MLPISISHPQQSRAPSRVTVTWGDKRHHSEHPPLPQFLPLPQIYMLSMMSYGVEYPCGQLGSAVPAVFLPSFSCTPSPLAGRVV